MIAKALPVLCGLAVQAMAQAPAPTPVSVAGAASVSAGAPSYLPILSTDGRYVVFVSSAKNLTTNDNLAPYLDVFRHDRVTGETILISRTVNGPGGANADSAAPSVSFNGQFIAFSSAASDLMAYVDGNASADIFLTYPSPGTLSLVSAAPDGNSPPNPVPTRNLPLSDKPRVSADGRWVAFESFATNLTAEADTNNDSDVFLRDTLSNRTVLVSMALEGGTTANGHSELSGITPDGRYVLFTSTATNVAANGRTTGYQEVYLRDVEAGSTTWIRHSNTIPAAGTGGPVPYNCTGAVMSRDASAVLYKVEFPGFTTFDRVHFYDRQADTNIVLATRARVGTPIHMSSDGRFNAYDTYDSNYHVVLWDRQSDTHTTVSGTDMAHSPVVSENGSIVAFLSGATNLQIYYRDMVTSQLRLVSQTLSGTASTTDHAGTSFAIDPGGAFIVFDSPEDNLVADDRNHGSDVFVHDIASGENRLISRAHENSPSSTALGAAGITTSCLSADGNRLLLISDDSTLVAGDTNGRSDAFLRDLQSGQTFVLSTNKDGSFNATNSVRDGVLSANGRYALLGVALARASSRANIVRKDLDTGEAITIVSNALSPVFPPVTPLFGFSMSANGQMIAYPLYNLVWVADLQPREHYIGWQWSITPTGPWGDVQISLDGRYVVYANTSTGTLLMSDLSNAQSTTIGAYLRGAAFSQNSQFVVYGTVANSTPGISVYSISGRTNTLVCANCANASVSADARFVVYEKAVSTLRQVELKDMVTGQTTLVTRNINGTGGGNTDTKQPIISSDGRFVVYTTKATNLTTDIPNGWNNLYVYDRLQGTTIRVTGSRGNTGYGSGGTSRPVLGPDGRTLVFQSFASDFVGNDFNDARDVFLLKLGGHDVDNDGMSDSWEQTYFGTTDRDGSGDFDQDGLSDLAEYLAGTNPTNGHSVFEVLTIASVGTGQYQLIWRAEPGKSYRVEYKSALEGATWTSLGQVVTAVGATASATDTTATAEKRFYRVVLVQ